MRWFGGGFRCKAKPDCFGSRDHTPQTRAENGCHDCRWVDACLDNQTAATHVIGDADSAMTTQNKVEFAVSDALRSRDTISEESAMSFLEMSGRGCISGQVSEWPQLIPSCRWAFAKIAQLKNDMRNFMLAAALPKYAILNEFDKPCPRLVAQLVNGKYYYLSRLEEPHMKGYDGMIPERPTDIQDFGFSILERGGIVHFTKTQDSVAFYKAPHPPEAEFRKWQDPSTYFHYKMVTSSDV